MHVANALRWIVPVLLLALAGPTEAAWYQAGWSEPQANRWGELNESDTPPVHYDLFELVFQGWFHFVATADRTNLRAYSLRRNVPNVQRSFASFRLDDVIFECDDARAEVTYRVQLDVDVTSMVPEGSANQFYVGDPHTPWGSGSGNWGSWRSDLGGTSLLAAVPPGDGFSQRLTGPERTVPTGVPVSIAVSIGASSGRFEAEECIIDSYATLPVGGPVFVLPDGCTCSSEEGGIDDNMLLDPVPLETVSWGRLKGTYD